jgi:hypothetical protein
VAVLLQVAFNVQATACEDASIYSWSFRTSRNQKKAFSFPLHSAVVIFGYVGVK